MPNSDVDSNPNPNKSERRPLLKKSRTLSDDFRNSSTIVSSNSLFPSMHRISTSPPSSSSSSSRFSVVGNSFDDDSSENRNVGISDRDWYYPSFLGPHTARNPVKIKATKSSKMELPPLPTLRVQNRPNSDSVSIESSNKLNSVRPSTLTVADHKPEVREVNKRVKVSNSCYALSSSSSSSTNPSFLKRILRFNSSSINLLLISTCILSVLYSAFLRMTVERLQREILNLHKLCGRNGVAFDDNIKVLQFEDETNSSYMYFGNANSRTLALYTVFVVLATPFLLFVCLDYLPYVKTLLKRNENNEEEVPLKKRIAYRVDVFFSVYPYAKLIALLFATILLIGFGGLALYAVSDGSLAEALWLTWTFIADSGNHADRVGTGPRIVSVSISSGGMLIFAMMLGLVSDAISEKVDSLRKGKSEVIERSHILILGWSDKLGEPVCAFPKTTTLAEAIFLILG